MAKHTYDEALRRVLVHEGGYVNHPSDPGGPTNFGITLAVYRQNFKANATADDIRTMPLAHAKAIYKTRYWDTLRCDELSAGVDYAVFDYGVNSGIGRSGKVLRRVLGLADDTHKVTDGVIVAVAAHDPAFVVAAICDERLAFLKRLKTWPTFGNGWGPRVTGVRSAGRAMTKKNEAAADPIAPAPGKGEVPNPTGAQAGTAGGAVVAGGAAAQQAAENGARPVVIAVILVVAIVIAILVPVWLKLHRDKKQEA